MFAIRPGKMVIPAPKDGACRVCGEIHGRGEAHNRDSLLYQHNFRMNHGRYPTWEDAMEHCSLTVKKRFCERLKRHGVDVTIPHDSTRNNTIQHTKKGSDHEGKRLDPGG